jgi:ATP-dependent Clp protease ATP-binding subunit ClpC
MGFKASEEINYIRSIRSFFSPEFYNRIDYVVTFLPLDKSAVRKIAYKELREVEKRDGLTRRNIHLEFTDAVVEFISSEGFDSSYGARPLQRAIENKIVSKIGRFMLKEKHIKNCTLKLDYYPERGVFIDLFP